DEDGQVRGPVPVRRPSHRHPREGDRGGGVPVCDGGGRAGPRTGRLARPAAPAGRRRAGVRVRGAVLAPGPGAGGQRAVPDAAGRGRDAARERDGGGAVKTKRVCVSLSNWTVEMAAARPKNGLEN